MHSTQHTQWSTPHKRIETKENVASRGYIDFKHFEKLKQDHAIFIKIEFFL